MRENDGKKKSSISRRRRGGGAVWVLNVLLLVLVTVSCTLSSSSSSSSSSLQKNQQLQPNEQFQQQLLSLTREKYQQQHQQKNRFQVRGRTSTPATKRGDNNSETAAQSSSWSFENEDPPVALQFPSYEDTLELATLSSLVYEVRHHHYNTTTVNSSSSEDDDICRNLTRYDSAVNQYTTKWLASDLECHWYHHDTSLSDTQVLIVSSQLQNYVAVVYAGTDDLKTSLVDLELLMTPFGSHDSMDDDDQINIPYYTDEQIRNIRIHDGFDKAVFYNHVFHNISNIVKNVLITKYKSNSNKQQQSSSSSSPVRLFTTGHSLGAASAVLTAVALNLEFQFSSTNNNKGNYSEPESAETAVLKNTPIISINFGCPRIGNYNWRNFVHDIHPENNKNSSSQTPFPKLFEHLGIWRFVLGWDLVPRLPEFLYHVGHTVQIQDHKSTSSSSSSSWSFFKNTTTTNNNNNNTTNNNNNNSALVYYQHYGDVSLDYADVPSGWYSKPFFWLPGALSSHHIHVYWTTMATWFENNNNNNTTKEDTNNGTIQRENWIGPDNDHNNNNNNNGTIQTKNGFVKLSKKKDDDDDKNKTSNNDDDGWVDPPDDDNQFSVRGNQRKEETARLLDKNNKNQTASSAAAATAARD